MKTFCVKVGDEYPLTIGEYDGPLGVAPFDLSDAEAVLIRRDDEPWRPAEVLDAKGGRVKPLPFYTVGEHSLEVEVHWPDGLIQRFPNGPHERWVAVEEWDDD